MKNAAIGRLLVAAVHQGIADVLPDRLDFYENWFNPEGLRRGTITLASFNAVLSFLRTEGTVYPTVMQRAGTLGGSWALEELPPSKVAIVRRLPVALRRRSALSQIRQMVERTYTGCQVRRSAGQIEILSSVFCSVRERSQKPLCQFYAAAASAMLTGFQLDAHAVVEACQAMGDPACRIALVTNAQRKVTLPVDTPAAVATATGEPAA
jgi:bacteriochlorophyll 4-vinyl reductase